MRYHAILLTILFLLAGIAPPVEAGELFAPGVISTGLQETSSAFSPDGHTVYFMRSDFMEKDDTILVSRLSGSQWSVPEVASFSGQWHDSEPAMSPDGKRLYFVSNRPVSPGGEPLTVEMMGQRYPGTNLWYVEQLANGKWGEPVHVDGAMNDGNQIYNPSVAANGNIYFSAHRPDAGKFYQVYVARRTATGYAAPEKLDLGDAEQNRMDPGVDPQERYMVFASSGPDSLGSADIYISFRNADGKWSKPEHLPGDVNSSSLENAPAPGRAFGELYVSSSRSESPLYPKDRDTLQTLQHRLASAQNGSRNIWKFDISQVLKAHGITQ